MFKFYSFFLMVLVAQKSKNILCFENKKDCDCTLLLQIKPLLNKMLMSSLCIMLFKKFVFDNLLYIPWKLKYWFVKPIKNINTIKIK